MPTRDWDGLLEELPPTERARITGLSRWEDQQDSARGWLLMQRLARRHGGGVRRDALGRPGTDGPGDVSLSHGGGWIAVAATGDGRLGIDVEAPRAVSPSLARRCLAPAELAWLGQAAGPDRGARFLRLWTAKEAYLKAIGLGLTRDPRDVRIDPTGAQPRLIGRDGGAWSFSCSAPAPGVCVTLCSGPPP